MNEYSFTINEEVAKVLIDGLGWKHSEGSMDSEDRKIIKPFLQFVLDNYPNIMEGYNYLYE